MRRFLKAYKNYTLLGIMYTLLKGDRMGYEDKKRYLDMYRHYVSRMNNYQTEIDFINSLYGLSSPEISDMPKAHNQSDLSDRVIKIDKETKKFINKLRREEEIAATKAREVLTVINTVQDETDRRILIARHIQLMNMKDIMKAEGYSRSGLIKRYKRAVNSVQL